MENGVSLFDSIDLNSEISTVNENSSQADGNISSEEDFAYIENGFIVDVSNSRKISDVIYQLSSVLDLPEAREKQVCIKLGSIDLTSSQILSIKALVETMNSEIAFISTTSDITEASAKEIDVKVSKLENKITTPSFDNTKEGSAELEKALDKIFGGVSSEAQKIKNKISQFAKNGMAKVAETNAESNIISTSQLSESNPSSADDGIGTEVDDFKQYDELNKELAEANRVAEIEEEKLLKELNEKMILTEKLPTLYIQRTLRSGQSITADGNIVIVGDVNPGSEIKAVGDITVWGVLGGIAHAGIEGNRFAKIRALSMNAIQLRIADVFARRPDGDNIPYIQKSDTYIPEVASVDGNNIIIHKMINK
ncbi:hypothetical protein J6S88_04425 [bacterium]|nr:hypothetical protein [bacterium]